MMPKESSSSRRPRPESPQRIGPIERIDPAMARIYAAMSGAERLAVANGMFVSARRMLVSHLRAEHPEWSTEEVEREASRRIAGGAL